MGEKIKEMDVYLRGPLRLAGPAEAEVPAIRKIM